MFDFHSTKGWIRSEFGKEKNVSGIMVFCCTVQRKSIFHLIRRMVISCGEIIFSKSKVTCLHIILFILACCKTEASSKPPGSYCESAEMRQINEDWQQHQAQEKVWASGYVECKCLQKEWNQSCQSGELEKNRKVSFISIDFFQKNNSNKRLFLLENEISCNFLGIFLASK